MQLCMPTRSLQNTHVSTGVTPYPLRPPPDFARPVVGRWPEPHTRDLPASPVVSEKVSARART
eukprot:6200355-Pleurochrysis_carterae.AAC.1